MKANPLNGSVQEIIEKAPLSNSQQETKALLTYILAKSPSSDLLARYTQALEFVDGNAAIGLNKIFIRWPVLLRLVDPPFSARTSRQKVLRKRLNAALIICETSFEGTHRLRQRTGENRWRVLLGLFGSLSADALSMPARLIIWRLW